MPNSEIEDSQSNAEPTSLDSTGISEPSKSEFEGHDQGNLWIEEFGRAHNDPKAEKYAGTLTVFRIRSQQFWRTGEVDLGWGKHANHVLVEHLPGKTHDGLLREPDVQTIAVRIAERIREAETKDTR